MVGAICFIGGNRQSKGWEQQGWDQPRLQKAVTREGTHRVKLIVNDGDHEASDEMTIDRHFAQVVL